MTRCGPVTVCKSACTSGHIRSSCRSPCGADDTGFKAGRDLLSGHSLAVTDQNLGVPDPKDQRLQPRAPGAQCQSEEHREEMGQSVCVCVCVFIHICICMCVCVHPRVYMHVPVCMYMCICMCVHTRVCTCKCVHAHVCLCVHACVYMYICVCARVYVCLCVHVYVCLCVQTALIRHKWPWVALSASFSCIPLHFYWQRAKCFQVRICCWVCLFTSWE